MSSAVLQVFPLGNPPWPTADPFLFCVHHDDAYPAGNAELGPAAALAGRQLGQDFAGKDGWRMYHGRTVPGFPRHPHRGFETVTVVRRGLIDHADSMGAHARYGDGDTQWMTAGAGVEHAEMFPLIRSDAPNPLDLFQIWLNLPAADKMCEPHFTMFWGEHTPVFVEGGARVHVVAGHFGDMAALAPPPHSWASRAESDIGIWVIGLDAGASLRLPAAKAGTNRIVYTVSGSWQVDGQQIPAKHGVVLDPTAAPLLVADTTTDLLVLQGRPIGEPVVSHGPFVMNTQAEIRQAFADYQRTRFGDWRWKSDAPVHGTTRGRFAVHGDGHEDKPPSP